MKKPLGIGVIGCGAATERLHLPALAALRITPTLLVDPQLDRARELGRRFGIQSIADSYESWLDAMDAAIVAVPHHLHAPVASDLLRRGVHVLVEKPLAPTEAQCAEVIGAAKATGAVLAVGLMRRFLRRVQWVKAALDQQLLGRIQSFDIREGFVYRWPVASDFFFRKETAGGGVLTDTGAHTLDLVLWWFGQPTSFAYYDDSHGGVEADCVLQLTFANGVTGFVELSRTRDLRSSAIIRGTDGSIEVGLHDTAMDALSTTPSALLNQACGGIKGSSLGTQRFRELFVLQIKDWLQAIQTRQTPLVSGSEAARSVALIERCYAARQPLEFPWEQPIALPDARLA